MWSYGKNIGMCIRNVTFLCNLSHYFIMNDVSVNVLILNFCIKHPWNSIRVLRQMIFSTSNVDISYYRLIYQSDENSENRYDFSAL